MYVSRPTLIPSICNSRIHCPFLHSDQTLIIKEDPHNSPLSLHARYRYIFQDEVHCSSSVPLALKLGEGHSPTGALRQEEACVDNFSVIHYSVLVHQLILI